MNSYKKILVAMLVAVFSIGAANAQLRFGVKAGLNVNNLRLTDASHIADKDNRCGWTAGVMTEFQVPVIGLCFDLSAMYTRMETEFTGSDADNISYNKNFLEIPLNIKYKFSIPLVGAIVKPYLFTGPSFAIKLDKNSLKAIQTKTCQTSWNIGLGAELVKHLQIGASYGIGMNNVMKLTDQWTSVHPDKVKAKNNYWTVTAAYLF